jgi:hypothetical protein
LVCFWTFPAATHPQWTALRGGPDDDNGTGDTSAGPNTSAPVGLYPSTTENQARDAAM